MVQKLATSWLFWLFWALAFLGFPMGGLLSNIIVGPVTTTARAALAGAITGAIVGLVQWFDLQSRLPLPIGWVIATSGGMALGLWSVFGSTGALTFQLLTGLVLYFLLRSSDGMK